MTARPLLKYRFVASQLLALVAGLLLTVPAEIVRLRTAADTKVGVAAWLFWINPDTTLPFLLLLLGPVAWFVRRRTGSSEPEERSNGAGVAGRRIDVAVWAMALACASVSIAASVCVASFEVGEKPPARFGDLPPAYHDEFSYLLQAKTFLAGRLSYPSSAEMPELFDQMHVVNEGRFASRYFPGVGAWLAPFLAFGHPYWAEWLGSSLTAFFIFWAGRELGGSRRGALWAPCAAPGPKNQRATLAPSPASGNAVGLIAGLLTALSPGMALFSNLLLSHQPTMAGLALFLFTFLRFMRTGGTGDVLWAGCGLSFAMLCRPMTAAGFALPFGLWLAWGLVCNWINGRDPGASSVGKSTIALRWRVVLVLAIPLASGLLILFGYDYAITGNGFVSPYQLYTDTYTPRHVYGFNNVVRGEQRLGPKVVDNYDRWAENLTPSLAAENVVKRIQATAQWTLGPVPLAMAFMVFLIAIAWQVDWRWRLVLAAIVTLHAVHVPYWFVGIMNWHYVFETGPLLLLILAVTSTEAVARWRDEGRLLMPAWWSTMIVLAVVTNWLPFDPFWNSRIESAVDEVAFARLKYAGFARLVDEAVTRRPALLLIEGDPADRSIDYVVNDPDLSAPVLRGRYRPGKTDLAKVRAAFPGRTLYLYRVRSGELERLTQ